MFGRIEELVNGRGDYKQTSFVDMFQILLSSVINGLDLQEKVEIWLTGASYSGAVYEQRVKNLEKG